jgi:hypothetical protein
MIAAVMGTIGEPALPLLLALSPDARIGASGLIVMTLLIEIFVYSGTQEQYYWLSILTLLVVTGPGPLSLDYLIRRRLLVMATPTCYTARISCYTARIYSNKPVGTWPILQQ